MTPKAARPLLLARRPDGSDDAALKEALAAASSSPELETEVQHWLAFDRELSAELAALPVGEEGAAKIAGAVEGFRTKGGSKISLKNPATIAVSVGVLLFVAVMVWNFLGRAGTFPDDAIKIATTGGVAAPTTFDEVQDKTEHLPDWFMLNGFDDFRLPPGFGSFNAVGVRLFKVEGENIAQVMVEADQLLYFYSFRAQPFGISVPPEGTWRFTESDRWAMGLREEKGVCFLVAMKGNRNDLRRALEGTGVMK